jgi:3-hydroxyacyl-CoA dehydrogenase
VLDDPGRRRQPDGQRRRIIHRSVVVRDHAAVRAERDVAQRRRLKMIVENSRNLGIERREISEEEIVGRLVFSLVNEGAKILEEKIAARASDIDIAYLYGYGFPPFRGGPMFYADTIGLYNVVRGIRTYQKGVNGEVWKLSTLLVKLAEEGKEFNS